MKEVGRLSKTSESGSDDIKSLIATGPNEVPASIAVGDAAEQEEFSFRMLKRQRAMRIVVNLLIAVEFLSFNFMFYKR